MSKQWYYSQEGQQNGPVSAAELKDLAKTGQIVPTDMVWSEGMRSWAPASSVKGLFIQSDPSDVPPHPPVPNPSVLKLEGASTGVCAFCQTTMPQGAVKCSSCQNWRKDIHILIRQYRRIAATQFLVLVVGLSGALSLLSVAIIKDADVGGIWKWSFSFEALMRSPRLWIAIFVMVVVLVGFVVTQIPAARIGNQIQRLTGGLWSRW